MSIHVRAIDQMSNHTAADLRGIWGDLIESPGVKDLAGGHLLVFEETVPNMSVNIPEGIVYVLNSSFTEFASTQRIWDILLDAEVNVVISANASGSTRIDIICVKVDTGVTPNADASNVATIIAVEGTPGAGVPSTPNDHYKIAEVEVVDGATTIPDAKITDTRIQVNIEPAFIDQDGITTTTTSATPTPTGDSRYNQIYITALGEASELQNPSGTAVNGNILRVRILDDGTGRALTFDTEYREVGVDLPTTTTADKTMYLGFFYNSADTKWDLVAVAEEE